MLSLVKSVLKNRGALNPIVYSRRNGYRPIKNVFNSKEDESGKTTLKDLYQLCLEYPRTTTTALATFAIWCIHRHYQRNPPHYPVEIEEDELDGNFIYPFRQIGNDSFVKKHFYDRPKLVHMWDHLMGIRNVWDFGSNKHIDVTSFKVGDYEHISRIITLEEAINFAREGGDVRLLIPPNIYEYKTVDNIVKSLHEMVTILTRHPINQCLNDQVEVSFKHIANSIESVNAQSLVDTSGFDAVAGDTIPQRRVSKETVVIICLTAILAHSNVPTQIPILLKLNVLSYLAVLYTLFEDDPEVVSLIVKILANISVDEATRAEIHKSGCLYILAKAARDKNIFLSFPAQRALLNIDRSPEGNVLMNGLYQMYPVDRYDDSDVTFDVVFVHGLLGSAFKTWRRQELSSVKEERRSLLTALLQERLTHLIQEPNSKYGDSYESNGRKLVMLGKSNVPSRYHADMIQMPEEEVMEYCKNWPKEGVPLKATDYYPHEINGVISEDTLCWPKDWLPIDCPNGRVLNVDFESFISKLWPSCPVEQYEEGLQQRSQEMMEKLVAAGVGKKPVVFVCHSMGGLLVKHIIVNADASTDPKVKAISEKTRSIFFYSTPHYGSDYGRVLLDKGGKLLIPTKEFEEISGSSDSLDDLVDLQQKFSRIYEKYDYHLVSLSESKPSHGGFGFDIYLVPRHSSDMGHGENFSVMLDHLNICKPFCRRSFVYAKLAAQLQSMFPSGNQCEKVTPRLVLQKDADCHKICAKLGLGEYTIIDPHLIVGPIRGPKEVAEWRRINEESEKGHHYPPDHDPTNM